MTARIFHWPHRVKYSECTVGNHVYYGRYLDILEEARGELFRATGRTLVQWQEAEILLPVIEVRVRYKASARYDDQITVGLWLNHLEGIRANFSYRLINQENRLLAEASTEHVCTSLRDKPRRLPPELVAQIGPYLAVASAAS